VEQNIRNIVEKKVKENKPLIENGEINTLYKQGELIRPINNVVRWVALVGELYQLSQKRRTFQIIQREREIVRELYNIKFGGENADRNASGTT